MTVLDGADAAVCWDAGSGLSLVDAVSYARRGRGDRSRPHTGWASLTPVESDVVRLVAEGHTNAEIGRRLFMSVNTVKKTCPMSTPRWRSTDALVSRHRSLDVTCRNCLGAGTYPVG